MKPKSKIIISLATVVVAIGAVIGCSKTDMSNEKNASLNESTKAAPSNICCKANCKDGTCYAYGSDCNCYCTIWGKPRCQGSSAAVMDMDAALFDGRIHVQLSPNITSNTNQLRNLLSSFGTDYALDAASILSGVDSLVNNYGLSLTTRKGVYEYYKMLDDLELLESHFTEKEIDQITDLVESFK